MPRYTYRCDHCKSTFEISHGMFFEQKICIKCQSNDTLTKIPDFAIKIKKTEAKQRVGKIVDQYIEEAKKELKDQRKDLSSEVFDK